MLRRGGDAVDAAVAAALAAGVVHPAGIGLGGGAFARYAGRTVVTMPPPSSGGGGSQIISAVLQAILGVLVFGRDAEAAFAEPRIHHQWVPDRLGVEPEVSLDVQRALTSRGHAVDVRRHGSAVQAVRVVGDRVEAGSDPRKGGRSAVVY